MTHGVTQLDAESWCARSDSRSDSRSDPHSGLRTRSSARPDVSIRGLARGCVACLTPRPLDAPDLACLRMVGGPRRWRVGGRCEVQRLPACACACACGGAYGGLYCGTPEGLCPNVCCSC